MGSRIMDRLTQEGAMGWELDIVERPCVDQLFTKGWLYADFDLDGAPRAEAPCAGWARP